MYEYIYIYMANADAVQAVTNFLLMMHLDAMFVYCYYDFN